MGTELNVEYQIYIRHSLEYSLFELNSVQFGEQAMSNIQILHS